MHPIFRRREVRRREIPSKRGSGRRRPGRAFLPGDPIITGLEPRRLLSAATRVTLAGVPMIERANVPYPTQYGHAEQLNVYIPPGPIPAGGRPVIIAIHGGGWHRLSKTGYGDRIASAFVPHGYVVVAPNYVLSKPGHPTWPANLDDVRSVSAWVRSNAAELGIDPDRVAAMGESAGGNLAELLGTDPGPQVSGSPSTQVQAVIAFSAPAALSTLYAQSPGAGHWVDQFLGGSPRKIPVQYTAASPIDHVAPGDPPMLLVHGLEDTLVPVDQSRAMAAALQSAGVTHQLILVQGGHDLDFPVHYGNLNQRLLEFLSATWNDGGTLSRS